MGTVGVLASGDLDLGAYVDVGDQQALAIEQIDFIFQGRDSNDNPQLMRDACSYGEFNCQVFDLNPGGALQFADDNSLIASGTLEFDAGTGAGAGPTSSSSSDFFPDVYGKIDGARLVVNDTLFIQGIGSGVYGANESVDVTVVVKARIVKLSTSDWMAIAIQSTASDN